MYHKAYGIIETLAPLHVGASAGEETGNLNLIFRDQFTQTGIVPGSSIRGRFRADMREEEENADYWYGHDASKGEKDSTTEGIVKFEYASILWIPVYCPNQPVVRVSCPALLKRYQKLTQKESTDFQPYSYFGKKADNLKKLFFSLGFLPLEKRDEKLKDYIPDVVSDRDNYLLVLVDDTEMPIIHDMALYRQSRVRLEETQKKSKTTGFFNVEALPEGTVLFFPIAIRKKFEDSVIAPKNFIQQQKIEKTKELYFGGLESVGFGRTAVTVELV